MDGSSNTTRQINRKKFATQINVQIPSLTPESRAAASWAQGEYFRCSGIPVIFPKDPAVRRQSQHVLAWMDFTCSSWFYVLPAAVLRKALRSHTKICLYSAALHLGSGRITNRSRGNTPPGTSAVHQNADHLPCSKT